MLNAFHDQSNTVPRAIYLRKRPLKSSGSIQTAVFTLAPERYQKSLNSIQLKPEQTTFVLKARDASLNSANCKLQQVRRFFSRILTQSGSAEYRLKRKEGAEKEGNGRGVSARQGRAQ